MGGEIIREARQAAGLTQEELAKRSKTSRTSLSAYEHGRKSPTLETTERILKAAGSGLALDQDIEFTLMRSPRGRVFTVPGRLPRLPVADAMASVRLPLHLSWSGSDRTFDMSDRRQRTRVYEVVLREGTADDILCFIDGVLLVDLWEELVLPGAIRNAWEPLVTGGKGR
ncbi:helix-turn-helix domain-containing protein [Salininema proteolyticum]|uniref:Multiprotein-bridging factor 1 family protein n=1 Tax=Salininema proteolyticum TaxID=1607685 RepID=A0ABV8TU32_9ACTN